MDTGKKCFLLPEFFINVLTFKRFCACIICAVLERVKLKSHSFFSHGQIFVRYQALSRQKRVTQFTCESIIMFTKSLLLIVT